MNLPDADLDKEFNILKLMYHEFPYAFWKDKQGRYRGVNQHLADSLGLSAPSDIIGKTIVDLLQDQTLAQAIEEGEQQVMCENKTLTLEEKMITPLGEKYYLTQKSPIHNSNGEVIGLLGFAMDITALKEQETAIKEERDLLAKTIMQAAHDLATPYVILKTLESRCEGISEKERSLLSGSIEKITDILNNQLTHVITEYINK